MDDWVRRDREETRRRRVSWRAVIDYWSSRGAPTQDLPHLASHWIGWEEPFCFRCGWMPPPRPALRGWQGTGGWLEQAHLVDRFIGGPDVPENLVPLCFLCHDAMPDLFTLRSAALQWISLATHPMPEPGAWQMFTDGSIPRLRLSGKGHRSTMLRLRGDFFLARADPELQRLSEPAGRTFGSANIPDVLSAAIYVRISRDKEGLEQGVQRQERDARALADRLGYAVYGVYSDNDLSASRNSRKSRPNYARMLEDVRSGRIHALLAYSTSRLTRRPREFEDLIDLAEKGLRVHTTAAGDVDLDTSAGRFYARMLAARDANEAEEASERAKRERCQRREQGRWNGGKRPFGWEPDGITPRPIEQDLIREACREILAGHSLRGIARGWMANGVPTPQGGPTWIPNTIREIVRNPRIAGLLPDEQSAQWPAIVDETTWRGVRAVLAAPGRDTGRGPARLLTSIAYCGVCDPDGTSGHRPSVCGGTDARKNPLYTCGNIRHLCRRVEPVDAWVTDVVLTWLSRQRLTPSSSQANTAPLASRAAGLRARLGEAADMFAAGTIDAAQLGRITNSVRADLEEAETKLATATSGAALSGLPIGLDALRAGWDSWDLDRRRSILRATGLQITVFPAGRGQKRFDSLTVRIQGPSASSSGVDLLQHGDPLTRGQGLAHQDQSTSTAAHVGPVDAGGEVGVRDG